MTLADSLSIDRKPSQNDEILYFALAGSVDAHSAPALSQLDGVPAHARVNLDFERVERVNSMGLSLLLKLFENRDQNRGRQSQPHGGDAVQDHRARSFP